MSASRKRWIVAVVVFGSTLLGCFGYLAYRAGTRTTTTTLHIVYKTMPADDEAMMAWLRSQPGVRQATVSRDGDKLILVYIMAVPSRGPMPEVLGAGEKFGYGGFGGFTGTFVFSGVFPWSSPNNQAPDLKPIDLIKPNGPIR